MTGMPPAIRRQLPSYSKDLWSGVALLFFTLLMVAQNGGTPSQTAVQSDKADEIRRRANQIAEVSSKQEGILDKLELTRMKMRLSESVLTKAREKRADMVRFLSESKRRVATLQAGQEAAENYLKSRIRRRYALGIFQEYRVFFAVNSTQDMKEAAVYLQALAEFDKRQIVSYKSMKASILQARSDVEQKQAAITELEKQTESEMGILAAERGELTRMLEDVDREKDTARQVLDESIAAMKKLDMYMEHLTAQKQSEMATRSMSMEKGQLPPPARGKVVAGFGDIIHPKFKTRVPHPGIDMSVQEDTPVKAVFDGEVSFAGWLSGYGYAVVVQHPGGFFTVYAHLDQVLVKPQDIVSQGTAIATAGSGYSSGRPLYFELRRGSQAVDPLQWLKVGGIKGKKRGR